MIKLFIIDDHELIIEGIHVLIQDDKEIEWIGSTKFPEDLILFLKNNQPDVILMDINLPQKSGLDLCKEVKENYPAIQIIGLSTSNELSIIKKMLDNGASGYLLKDASKNEIITAIKEVNKGKENVNFSVAEILKTGTNENKLPALTKRETEILQLISEGFTNHEIAAKLFLDSTTVDSHRKNMLKKYNTKNTASLIKLAIVNNLIQT